MQPLIYLFSFSTLSVIILLIFVTIITLPKENLTKYLIGLTTATTIFILLFLTIIILPKERSIFEKKTYDQLSNILELKDNQITSYLHERQTDLTLISATLDQPTAQLLEIYLTSHPKFSGLYLYTPDGTLTAQAIQPGTVASVISTLPTEISGADLSTLFPYIYIRLLNQSILVATLDPHHIHSLLVYGFTEPKGIEIYAVNTKGTIISTVKIATPEDVQTPEILNCKNIPAGYRQRNNYEQRIVYSAWKWSEIGNICIVAEDPARHAQQSVNELILFQLATSITAIFISMGMSYILSHRIVAPIITLRDATKSVAAGKLNTKITPIGPLEIYDLALAFNRMGTELNASSEYKTKLMKQKENEAQKIRTIIDTMTDGVIVLDASGTIVLTNPLVPTLIGMKNSHLLNQPFAQAITLISEDKKKQLSLFIQESLPKKNQVTDLRCLLQISGGQTIPVSISSSPLFEQNEYAGQVIVCRDISKDKEMDTMKNDFISLISHQLRTPLTAIRWISKKLIDKKDLPQEKKQEQLQDIYTSTLRLITFVSDLLNVSRIESGKINIVIEQIDISQIVQSVISEIELTPSDKGVMITKNLPTSLIVDTDPKLIRQVVQNLIDNAVKYSNDHGHVHVTLKENAETFEVRVEDNGKGIPMEAQAHIFSKYYRAQNVTKIHYTDGTGLGLYFCKQIVELFQGTISFTSLQNQGTTFTVTLPKKIEHTSVQVV